MTNECKQNILKGLEECCFDELCEDTAEGSVFEYVDFNIFDNDFATGASKMVLYPLEAKDYVVKIPFEGYICEDWNYDTDEPNYYFAQFEEAPFGDSWDYCYSEMEFYDLAEESKVSEYFLKVERIGRVGSNHPIYIQRKAEIVSNISKEYRVSNEERTKSMEICKENHVDWFNLDWTSHFIRTYGVQELIKLDVFIKGHGMSDFHDGNLGYCDGKPVIVDYGGYYD